MKLVAALSLLASSALAQSSEFAVVGPGVYSIDQVGGPFATETAHVLFVIDVDALTGVAPTWRVCVQVQDALDSQQSPHLVSIGCSTPSNAIGEDVVLLFSPSYAGTPEIDEVVTVPIPKQFWALLDLDGSAIFTGQISGAAVH